MNPQEIRYELALREMAKRDLKTFVQLHFERYKKTQFFDNWHIDYLCKILEATLPKKHLHSKSVDTRNKHKDNAPRSTHSAQSPAEKLTAEDTLSTQNRQSGSICEEKLCFSSEGARSLLSINDEARERRMHDFNSKDNVKHSPITRLMVNMPPSYGKTEIIARNFIAWALGNFPHRKFFYVSYSDELCKKVSNQVRDLMKSNFYMQVFGRSPQFLQDNVSEFMLKEGGGLFCTTLKASLTGFHAHQILIDDPIKVADMNSRAERNRVNQTFKESVLSRLQDRDSNITILMQRLGDEDLCGFLLNPKHFPQEAINAWKVVKLQAINKEPSTYSIGNFTYHRQANEPLAIHKHTLAELEDLKLKMGDDEFSTQYLQEPQVSEAGYFESVYFKLIPSYELGEHNSYIFVDNATSLETNADNRAIVLVACESLGGSRIRYCLKDCVFGIWSEEETISQLLSLMSENPTASVYIESDGGGLTLERLLQKELSMLNTKLKYEHKSPITNSINCYNANRKISKVEKIKAMRSYYNTGELVFLHNARGLEQVKKELLGFNPNKPFRKDDCIDALASAMAHPEVRPKHKREMTQIKSRYYANSPKAWRV